MYTAKEGKGAAVAAMRGQCDCTKTTTPLRGGGCLPKAENAGGWGASKAPHLGVAERGTKCVCVYFRPTSIYFGDNK